MMINKTRVYLLALKYWMRGGKWSFAVKYAEKIVNGWKK